MLLLLYPIPDSLYPVPTVQALLPRSSSAEWASAPMEAIRLIDYEYAGLNPVAYDIANHWCEYAADYGTASPEVLDYGKLPSPEQGVSPLCFHIFDRMPELKVTLGITGFDPAIH